MFVRTTNLPFKVKIFCIKETFKQMKQGGETSPTNPEKKLVCDKIEISERECKI